MIASKDGEATTGKDIVYDVATVRGVTNEGTKEESGSESSADGGSSTSSSEEEDDTVDLSTFEKARLRIRVCCSIDAICTRKRLMQNRLAKLV